MSTKQAATIARADVVGSLLRPAYLRQARQAAHDGQMSDADLRAVEDRAVREAIALQEVIGLDVITDGEMRREGWNAPLRAALSGFYRLCGRHGIPLAHRRPGGKSSAGRHGPHLAIRHRDRADAARRGAD